MSEQQQRNKQTYRLAATQAAEIKNRMLNWVDQFSIHVFLDTNNYASAYGRYECVAAAGSIARYNIADAALQGLYQFHTQHKDWLFGHLGYDLKNVLHNKLSSQHQSADGFDDLHFFVPETVCLLNIDNTRLTIETYLQPDEVYKAIMLAERPTQPMPRLNFTRVLNKEAYIATINKIRQHIANGDCYELNLCNKGYCSNVAVDPFSVYKALNALSPAPFAAYYRLRNKYMMCASPERYMQKTGSKLISQPIKGTAPRNSDATLDEQIKTRLHNNIKERAENVMIVDLVRNDIARSCEVGSVTVDELFGIYSYPQVHQMISTVSGTMQPALPFTEAIRHSFPMGSMTGAPKYKVMQLIDEYEPAARNLFSGSVGYITPGGDFDFNVIIRSLFYDADSRVLHYQSGGAITWDSVPEEEWKEIELKAWAMERIFS